MKTRICMSITAIGLFAVLAIPVRLAAQENKDPKEGHVRYKLIDLGTFGGPASYFANGFDGMLNNRGTAAGGADTSTPDPYPQFCFNFDCFVSHAFRWQKGVLADLGTLPGGASSMANWISANGLIIGTAQNGAVDPLFSGFPENHAVLWQNSGITDLGTLEGGYESWGLNVNNRGQVVGFALNTIPDPFSLAAPGFFPTQTRAYLWQNGAMQDLGTLGSGNDAAASLVNERGEVAGESYTTSTPNPVTGIPTQDPFLWKNGTMLDLGTLGGTVGLPKALNNRGQVAGDSNLAGDSITHPFLWDEGVLTDLGTLGGENGLVNWLNEAGEIAGKADLSGPFPQNHDAFLWKDGVMTDLGTMPGDSCSNAYFVNSRGQVVGTSEDRAHCLISVGVHAFLWEDGGPMIDLNTLVPPGSGLQLTYAVAINDRGEIAGFGVPPGVPPSEYETKGHAYILIPCDGDNLDGEDCQNGDEGGAAMTQSHPAPVGQTSTAAAHGNLTPETLASTRARMARRFPYRGLGPVPAPPK